MPLRQHYLVASALIALGALLLVPSYFVTAPPRAFGTAVLIAPFALQIAYVIWVIAVRRHGQMTDVLDACWLLVLVAASGLASQQREFGGTAADWASGFVAAAPNPKVTVLILTMAHAVMMVRARSKPPSPGGSPTRR